MTDLDYTIQLDTLSEGFDGETCWVQARAGAIPGAPPSVVLTMQKLELQGSDVFHELNEMRSDDMGAPGAGPHPTPTPWGVAKSPRAWRCAPTT